MSAAKPNAVVQVTWRGEQRFDSGRPDGPTLRLDGRGETGQSPVDGLLSALAACTAVDVVDILAKRRTPLTALSIDAIGQRADAVPARIVGATLTYHVQGEGIERVHAERAIELAITKYCSVRDSLDPALPIDYVAVINGEAGTTVRAGTAR
jgi:putative redox protein